MFRYSLFLCFPLQTAPNQTVSNGNLNSLRLFLILVSHIHRLFGASSYHTVRILTESVILNSYYHDSVNISTTQRPSRGNLKSKAYDKIGIVEPPTMPIFNYPSCQRHLILSTKLIVIFRKHIHGLKELIGVNQRTYAY